MHNCTLFTAVSDFKSCFPHSSRIRRNPAFFVRPDRQAAPEPFPRSEAAGGCEPYCLLAHSQKESL